MLTGKTDAQADLFFYAGRTYHFVGFVTMLLISELERYWLIGGSATVLTNSVNALRAVQTKTCRGSIYLMLICLCNQVTLM